MIKRKVIDTSAAGSPELGAFLKQSAKNIAVIPDGVAAELYAAPDVVMLHHNFRVLAKFPHQVLILQPSGDNAGLVSVTKEPQKHLVDEVSTREFPSFCSGLAKAVDGDEALQLHFAGIKADANEWMGRVKTNSPNLLQGAFEISANLSKHQLAHIREAWFSSPHVVQLFFDSAGKMASLVMTDLHIRSVNPNRLSPKAWLNMIVFRFALCTLIGIVQRIDDGALDASKPISPKAIANDLVDAHIAAYATYFDGLVTCDPRLKKVYAKAVQALNAFNRLAHSRAQA